jgi:hypothetical protein
VHRLSRGFAACFQGGRMDYGRHADCRFYFTTLKTVGGNQVYNQAPMSTLLLDERPPIFTLTKNTDTFSSRHHLRAFDPLMKYEGETVLTSSSTQDIGIVFSSKQKTFIHVIDEYIDNDTLPEPEIILGYSSLVTRQFDYNLLWSLRPRKSRWAPYIGRWTLAHSDGFGRGTPQESGWAFKLGLQNVGLLLAAFDFGSTPPLDGGGVFSVGVQYGAGIKVSSASAHHSERRLPRDLE